MSKWKCHRMFMLVNDGLVLSLTSAPLRPPLFSFRFPHLQRRQTPLRLALQSKGSDTTALILQEPGVDPETRDNVGVGIHDDPECWY